MKYIFQIAAMLGLFSCQPISIQEGEVRLIYDSKYATRTDSAIYIFDSKSGSITAVCPFKAEKK